MIKITQGFRLQRIVDKPCTLIIRGSGFKSTINSLAENGKFCLIASADETSSWPAGTHKYQIQTDDAVIESGDFIIIQNFALSDEDSCIKTKNELYLDAIEATLAGRATAAQASMSVGDKSIQYMSVDELLKLRDYFQAKVDTEQNKYSTNNRARIKYKWSIR